MPYHHRQQQPWTSRAASLGAAGGMQGMALEGMMMMMARTLVVATTAAVSLHLSCTELPPWPMAMFA